jgi:hypothetical protein
MLEASMAFTAGISLSGLWTDILACWNSYAYHFGSMLCTSISSFRIRQRVNPNPPISAYLLDTLSALCFAEGVVDREVSRSLDRPIMSFKVLFRIRKSIQAFVNIHIPASYPFRIVFKEEVVESKVYRFSKFQGISY